MGGELIADALSMIERCREHYDERGDRLKLIRMENFIKDFDLENLTEDDADCILCEMENGFMSAMENDLMMNGSGACLRNGRMVI